MAYDALKGMVYLESQNIVHRDLAARNCLVKLAGASGYTVLISDLGQGKELADNFFYDSKSSMVPVRWSAPEIVRQFLTSEPAHYSTKSDVWSYGVLVWEVMTCGDVPYFDMNNMAVCRYVYSGKILEQPADTPDTIYDFMCRCWQYDEEQRPTFKMLLEEFTRDESEMRTWSNNSKRRPELSLLGINVSESSVQLARGNRAKQPTDDDNEALQRAAARDTYALSPNDVPSSEESATSSRVNSRNTSSSGRSSRNTSSNGRTAPRPSSGRSSRNTSSNGVTPGRSTSSHYQSLNVDGGQQQRTSRTSVSSSSTSSATTGTNITSTARRSAAADDFARLLPTRRTTSANTSSVAAPRRPSTAAVRKQQILEEEEQEEEEDDTPPPPPRKKCATRQNQQALEEEEEEEVEVNEEDETEDEDEDEDEDDRMSKSVATLKSASSVKVFQKGTVQRVSVTKPAVIIHRSSRGNIATPQSAVLVTPSTTTTTGANGRRNK
jgi:serine/threonine protein kinase